VSLAVTISALVSVVAATRAANAMDYVGPDLGANQLVVNAPAPGPEFVGPGPRPAGAPPAPPAPPAPRAPAQLTQAQMQARAGAIAAAVGAHGVLPLIDSTATLFRTTDPNFQNFNGTVWVATPRLLQQFGIAPGSIRPGTDILTSRPGLDAVGHLNLIALPQGKGAPPGGSSVASCPPSSCIAHPVIQETSRLPTGTQAPNVVITEQALHRLGLTIGQPASWLVVAPHNLTATQRSTAEELAAAAGMTVQTRSAFPSLKALETWSTVAGIMLALGVLAMTSGLIRSETAGDLRTLTATGASSRVRRAITAATAGGIGLLGGVMGTAVGVVGVSAFYRHHLHDVWSGLPTTDLLLLVVALPAAAAVGGWLFAGREPPAIAHQPLE